jgi:hypothetical protein
MDMSAIAARLGLSGSRPVVRKAAELRRLCDVTFDSSVLGVVSAPSLARFVALPRMDASLTTVCFAGRGVQGHHLPRDRRLQVTSSFAGQVFDELAEWGMFEPQI